MSQVSKRFMENMEIKKKSKYVIFFLILAMDIKDTFEFFCRFSQ